MGRTRKPGELSSEDKTLWKKVTDATETLHPSQQSFAEILKPPKTRSFPSPQPIRSFKIGEKAKISRESQNAKPDIAPQFAKTSPNMDGRNYDRLIKGKLGVDGTLDLHGMTLAEAQPALTGFILRSHMAGSRLLLVITGKGKTYRGEGLLTARRGILREQVPAWLQMHPLAPKVLQVTQAHGKHGGGGALYVYLRRQR